MYVASPVYRRFPFRHPSLPTILFMLLLGGAVRAADLNIANSPLVSSTAARPNVLIILDNSNSMDENVAGFAVGSFNTESKSEKFRQALRNVMGDYTGALNLGLMAFQQQDSNPLTASLDLESRSLYRGYLDVSYDSSNFDGGFNGDRNSATKGRATTLAGEVLYYNQTSAVYWPVALAVPDTNSAFCYSPTARFDNRLENASFGPWDFYRCFSIKTGSADGTVSPLPFLTTPTSEEVALGYSTLRTFAPFSAVAQFVPGDNQLRFDILDFGQQMALDYVGESWFSRPLSVGPARGFLHVPIKALDVAGTQLQALRNKLACNVPGQPASVTVTATCGGTGGIRNAGLTPLPGTLRTARDYFNGTASASTEGFTPTGLFGVNANPIPKSCDKNFVLVTSDGAPTADLLGFASANADSMTTLAENAANELRSVGVATYVVGLGVPPEQDTNRLLERIAAAGGGAERVRRPADDGVGGAISGVLNLAEQASSPVAIGASGVAATDTRFFVSGYSTGWTGFLQAFPINADGTVGAALWDAADAIPAAGSRNIFSYDPTNPNTSKGIDLASLANLNAAQADSLNRDPGTQLVDGKAARRLAYLRGDTSEEKRNGGGFRDRRVTLTDGSVMTTVLGDIVNSDPVIVQGGNFRYSGLPAPEGTAYVGFRGGVAGRRRMVYAGANDGMLHGFNAGQYDTASGTFNDGDGAEQFAYVPNALFPKLGLLTWSDYSHRFFVDGTPRVADAYVPVGGSPAWRTLLVGTTGAGAKAVFALDVTNPDNFGTAQVLWEISASNSPVATDLTDQPGASPPVFGFANNLGYTFAQASIVRLENGQWVAIFGNGYGSTRGSAVLYIVDAASGNLIRSIDTGFGDASNPNGLSTPIVADNNDNLSADTVYAGDLKGNLWKFDVSGGSASAWTVAYTSSGLPAPMFVACAATESPCQAANRQPIVAKPQVGRHTATGAIVPIVFFGTGKYFENGDSLVDADANGTVDTTVQTQTFYGVLDLGATVTRSDLQPQYIATETTTTAGLKLRLSTACSPVFTGSGARKGWYMDLLQPTTAQSPTSCSAPSTQRQGERVVSAPLLRGNRVIFVSLIPSLDSCTAGGDGWLLELEAETGNRLPNAVPPWDVAGGSGGGRDGVINQLDLVSLSSGTTVAPSGKQSSVGIVKTPAVVSAGNVEYKITGGGKRDASGRNTEVVRESASRILGRQSWTQLR